MRLLLLSDLHANLSALKAVFQMAEQKSFDAIVCLGDVIDYGMRPNETIEYLLRYESRLCCAVWGNHEKAVVDHNFQRFSTSRGAVCARLTIEQLTPASLAFINGRMSHAGYQELDFHGLRCLAIHGSLADPYWGYIYPGVQESCYLPYDVVFSGHSHRPHLFEQYYCVDVPALRNQKRVRFFNPGSVGQPRNQNPNAQCGLYDTESEAFEFLSVPYDIDVEQKLYHGQVAQFYRDRLKLGL